MNVDVEVLLLDERADAARAPVEVEPLGERQLADGADEAEAQVAQLRQVEIVGRAPENERVLDVEGFEVGQGRDEGPDDRGVRVPRGRLVEDRE